MPIYEFVCGACGHKSSFLTRSVNSPLKPICRSCSGTDLQRAVSSFAYHLTTKDVHGAYRPPPQYPAMDYYKDPRNIGRNVEETFKQSNMEMPQEIRDSIDAAREGTMPKEIDL